MTFNQDWLDAQLRRQIDLLRFGSGLAKRVRAILEETHADVKAAIARKLAKGTQLDASGIVRLRELERAIGQRRSGAWNDVTELWTTTAVEVALDEAAFAGATLTRVLPVQLDLVAPSDRTLSALATSRPFQGRNLKEWAKSAEVSDLTRIKQQLRIGMVQGETVQQITSRIFGASGAALRSLREADAVTRTAINHVSNVAQQEFLGENADLFDEELMVATLDARTTLQCAGEDGKRYPHGKGPIPPLHVRCRTIRVGLLDGEAIGERPFVAATEAQMLREYTAQNGLQPVKNASDLPRGHAGKYDKFRRARMRELTGQVPAKTTYEEWLRGQPEAFQIDVLGETRAKLFREGGLKLDKFTHRDGDELTLDELRTRYQSAWSKAGLDKPPPAPVTQPGDAALGKRAQRVQTFGAVTAEHQAAAARALERLGAGRGSVPLLERVIMTDRIGRGEFELPIGTAGDYLGSQGRLRLSTNGETLGRFLRAVDLSEVPGYTANFARDIDAVLEMAAAHEYAHHVHISGLRRALVLGAADASDELIKASFAASDRQLVSRYAGWNPAEYWAESLVAYHYYPRDWLAANAPKVITLVENVLRLKGLL